MIDFWPPSRNGPAATDAEDGVNAHHTASQIPKTTIQMRISGDVAVGDRRVKIEENFSLRRWLALEDAGHKAKL